MMAALSGLRRCGVVVASEREKVGKRIFKVVA